MSAMTMDFSVHDPHLLAGLCAGDQVAFTLVVTDDDDWIEGLHKVGETRVPVPDDGDKREPELQVGDALPEAEFTTEQGGCVRFSDFRGRTVAFTFFFTRPRVWLDAPRVQRLCARTPPKRSGLFRAFEVFREGAENRTRGACVPHPTSEFGCANDKRRCAGISPVKNL